MITASVRNKPRLPDGICRNNRDSSTPTGIAVTPLRNNAMMKKRSKRLMNAILFVMIYDLKNR